MGTILRVIYRQSIPTVAIVVVICIIAWAIVNRKVRKEFAKKIFWIFNCVLFLVGCVVILGSTIWGRTKGEVEICLIPFYTLFLAHEQPEMYRSMFMNVLLFVPFGMSMPYLLQKSCKRRILSTVLFAMLLSLVIEVVQCVFLIGRAEIDDVICNTVGTMVGCLSYFISAMPKVTKSIKTVGRL